MRFDYPLKIRLFEPEGTQVYVVTAQPSDLIPVVQGVYVAYFKQRCGGVATSERLDAVIVPRKECHCAPDTAETEQRMREMGCVVHEFDVRLEVQGESVFLHRLPMACLAPVANGLIERLGLGAGTEADEEKSEEKSVVWQLAADFLTALPARSTDAEAEDEEEMLEIDAQDPLELPCLSRPAGRPIGEMPEGTMPVYVRPSVLDMLLQHAQRSPEIEIGGALLGQVARDEQGDVFVVVEEAPLLTTQSEKFAVTFRWEAFREVRERLDVEKGRVLLGLFHSHPAACTKAFASQQDIWGFRSFFSEPWNIFAVVGTALERSAFFQWSLQGDVQQAGFYRMDDEEEDRYARKEHER